MGGFIPRMAPPPHNIAACCNPNGLCTHYVHTMLHTVDSQFDEPLEPPCCTHYHTDGVLVLYPLHQLQHLAQVTRTRTPLILRGREGRRREVSMPLSVSYSQELSRNGVLLTMWDCTNLMAPSRMSTAAISLSLIASRLNSLQWGGPDTVIQGSHTHHHHTHNIHTGGEGMDR